MTTFTVFGVPYRVERSADDDWAVVSGPRGGVFMAEAVGDAVGLVWSFRRLGAKSRRVSWISQAGDAFRQIDGKEAGERLRLASIRPDLAAVVASLESRGDMSCAAIAWEVATASVDYQRALSAQDLMRTVESVFGEAVGPVPTMKHDHL